MIKHKSLPRLLGTTHILIILNVAIFIFLGILNLVLVSLGKNALVETIGSLLFLNPALFFKGYLWTIFTSMFIHAGLLHLFVNMLSLLFLGQLVEQIIGKKRFFWLYIISGLMGGLFFVSLAYLGTLSPNFANLFGSPAMVGVGASGALFGLLGLLAMIMPDKKVYLVLGPLIVIILQLTVLGFLPTSLQTTFSIIFSVLIFVMIFGMFSSNRFFRTLALPVKLSFWVVPIASIVPLLLIGFFISLPIGNMAHFGGLVAGLLYGFYLRTKFPKKISMLNRIFR